jgi:hypothetical protein
MRVHHAHLAVLAITAPWTVMAGGCDPVVVHTVESVESTLPPPRDPALKFWLRQEFAWIRAACARGNDVEAVWRIENIVSRTHAPLDAVALSPAGHLHPTPKDFGR